MASSTYICSRCALTLHKAAAPRTLLPLRQLRQFSRTPRLPNSNMVDARAEQDHDDSASSPQPDAKPSEEEPGALSRRLEEATEEALLTGGRAGRRAVLEDAGFNEELKARLLDKLADANFQAEYSSALAEAGIIMPSSAGQGTRNATTAKAWTGEEATEDTLLRMLDDAHKPLRPGLRGKPLIPTPVDLRPQRDPGANLSPGLRAASAREKAAAYTGMGMGKNKSQEQGLSDHEREAMKKEFRERFSPGARAMPNTLSGLAALANERIEDAIARGQFRDIPRGKGVERDARADNPFIDTTEYIMNKMIKRQEIVPPWIEKQQELARAAGQFRARIRMDWRRHAARVIASGGGSLEDQMRRAEEYARAEEVHNPRRRNSEQIAVPTNATDDVVMVEIRRQPRSAISNTEEASPGAEDATTPAPSDGPQILTVRPFRDPAWEAAERSYMELSVANLNAMARSYNLMAPELAKKPYFSLERELRACFADVARELPATIKDRAARPARANSLFETVEKESRGVLSRLSGEGSMRARVYDSKAPHYGFKEMWRDWWGGQSG